MPKTKKPWYAALAKLHPCTGAMEWVRTQKSAATAWKSCKRGDWMLWLLGHVYKANGGVMHRRLVLAACACARLTLHHVRPGYDRPRIAIETAEAWARGGAGAPTLDRVKDAAAAASAYAAYAAAAASAYAAYASAYAAYAAYARASTLAQCADIVRGFFPRPPKLGRSQNA